MKTQRSFRPMASVLALAVFAAGLTTGGQAMAQSIEEVAVDYRQGVFQVFRWNMGVLGPIAQGQRDYDADRVAKHVDQLSRVADMPWQGFIDGSDLPNSDAKNEVWSDRASFDERARAFESEVAALRTAVDNGAGEREVRMQIGRVAQSCRACHDSFRN
ncbi:MAG: c-type cytochrome [Thioalkalivibrionaceae bacterium]